MGRRPRKKVVEPAGAVLDRVLRRAGLEAGVREQRAITLWPQVVGAALARVTEALYLRQGRLVVRVEGASWRSELHHLLPQLLQRLNRQLESPIREIKLTAGRVDRSQRPADAPPAPPPQRPAAAEESVASAVERARLASVRAARCGGSREPHPDRERSD